MASLVLIARRWLHFGLGALALTACTTSSASVQVRSDGRLRVSPSEFTDDVGCSFASGNPGALAYYTVTLIDLGPINDTNHEAQTTDSKQTYPREVGSTPVARCSSTTTISTNADSSIVEVGHSYSAIIDGFGPERTPTVKGDRSPRTWTAPHWQWLCGVGGLSKSQLRWLSEDLSSLPRTEPSSTVVDAGDGPAPSAGRTGDGDASTGSADSTAGAVSNMQTGSANLGEPDAAADAASPNGGAADAAVTSTQSLVRDAGASTNSSTAVGDAGAVGWLGLAETAALDGFPGPAKVTEGGQSGLLGCIAAP